MEYREEHKTATPPRGAAPEGWHGPCRDLEEEKQ